ncbi:thioesterase, partial [Oleiphilus sp. HI0080]
MAKQPVFKNTFRHFQNVQTRWMDNDVYGHVNNVVYYSYFDSVVNTYLIDKGGLDIQNGAQIGFIVNSNCVYQQSIAFPESLVGALRVDRIGNSSVDYGVALFKEGQE